MKKLVLFVAVVVAVSFASCKKNAAQLPVVEEETVIEEVVAAVDSIAAEVSDSIATEVAAIEEEIK